MKMVRAIMVEQGGSGGLHSAGGGQVLFLVLEVPAALPEVLALTNSHFNGEK